MRKETRAEFSLCFIFCQLLSSIGAYFSLWGYRPEVDFTHQQCWVLSLSLRAPHMAPSLLAHCTKVLSARGHLEMDAISWEASRNQYHLTPSRLTQPKKKTCTHMLQSTELWVGSRLLPALSAKISLSLWKGFFHFCLHFKTTEMQGTLGWF